MVALAKTQPNTHLPIDEVIHGEALEILRSLPANSVDAIVSDPPSSIHFMGRDWDSDKGGRTQWVAWLSEIMQEALRCLKPGGYGLIWALPRTSHWTALALEDAGFLVKDCVTHIQGQGFPKSMDISRAIDKQKGAEREVIGIAKGAGMSPNKPKGAGTFRDDNWVPKGTDLPVTAPATPEAQQWNGYGTALKPSTEFWWLVQKPISEKTIAANVLKWGTGGINVDGCRVGSTGESTLRNNHAPRFDGTHYNNGQTYDIGEWQSGNIQGKRFPSHLLLSHSVFCVPRGVKQVQSNRWGKGNDRHGKDGESIFNLGKNIDTRGYEDPDGMETIEDWECVEDCPIYQINLQSGIRKSGAGQKAIHRANNFANGGWKPDDTYYPGDQGGASRYFQCFSPDADDFVPFLYQSKASRAERNAGCEGLPEYPSYTEDTPTPQRDKRKQVLQGNNHPTVKSLALMSWLCRLITPPDGIVLDPFAGSGSTLVACIHEGFHFIGIEQEQAYVDIALARISHAIREVEPC